MAQEINRLTALFVKTVKKPGLYHDGGGLYLQVKPSRTTEGKVNKSWLFRLLPTGWAGARSRPST